VRLVMDRKVTLRWVSEDRQAAQGVVDGDTGTYHVSYSPEGRICTCPAGANHRQCSHGIALELEVLRMREGVGV